LPLTEGTGSVCGFELKGLKRKQIPFLRRKIGIVFQDFQLLTDRNVLDNLKFVLGATGWNDKKLIEQRAMNCLQLVGIEKKAKDFPHQLSGGEQQRVSIARALLNKPTLILADEPTGNLDPATSKEIMELLLAVAKEENTAILMATHDMQMVAHFPGRILEVSEGKVIEQR
jgi:cell division transport system ATP-binding protein